MNHSIGGGIQFGLYESAYVNDEVAMHLHEHDEDISDLHDGYNEITLDEESDTPPPNQYV